jgi:hypothetical protein
MTEARTPERLRTADVIERYGNSLELVPLDSRFHNISVGLYLKDGIYTVWSFSGKPGVEERIREIRDHLVALGGMVPVEGTHNQARFPYQHPHRRALKFLLAQAVGKAADYAHPEGDLTIRDTRTKLMITVSGQEKDGKWVYEVSGEGEAPNIPMRLRMIVAGFTRYGEMEKISDTEVMFSGGQRNDALVKLLLPYARNISSVESMLDAEALRGQMTTRTLGFTPL